MRKKGEYADPAYARIGRATLIFGAAEQATAQDALCIGHAQAQLALSAFFSFGGQIAAESDLTPQLQQTAAFALGLLFNVRWRIEQAEKLIRDMAKISQAGAPAAQPGETS